jgi:hypothetical protein
MKRYEPGIGFKPSREHDDRLVKETGIDIYKKQKTEGSEKTNF